MPPASRVLVFDREARRLRSLPRLLERAGLDVVADTSASISNALDRLRAGSGYDAVLCRVDGPDEVSFLLRLKRTAPRVPVIAVTPGADPALEDLARESGADLVHPVRTEEVPSDRAASFRDLIEHTRQALDRSTVLAKRTQDAFAEHRRLEIRHRILAERRIEEIRKFYAGFAPLLVEDDPEQIALTSQAFRRASFELPLPPLKDGMEAIRYLSGRDPYGDRARHPLPTLAILDIDLPRQSGLEVLEWVRSRREFNGMPVFMLTGSPHHFDKAMDLGATDFFVKPFQFRSLVDIVREIAVRWWFLEQARRSSKKP